MLVCTISCQILRPVCYEKKKKNTIPYDYQTYVCPFRMALGQSEAVEMQKESTARAVAAEFQREMHAREEELKKEARKQILLLQEQLREALKSQQQDIAQSEKDALIHSLHAEYQRTLHSKQEDWKRETKLQVEIVTSQLREAQRQCQELMAKLAATTNDAEQTHKLRQDVNALKMQNKELDEKVQVMVTQLFCSVFF